ncbi:MAG: hypothetical protein KGH74_04610, partial [Candidatus Micrarchaeota archaeon]|nr:hypothetical protein [Candidatus Micrarchaeota archaeon]
EEDTLEMAGREETAIVGLRKLKDEIAGDISALKGYKDGTIKDDPGITNKDVNMKMYRLFIVGHALVHALNEEQKSAISDDRKKSLENLKIQTEIELTRANQMIKDAQGMLGKGKSLNMAKFREADSGLVALVSGFLRAEEAREADLKSSIEDKLRSLSRLMGIPAIRIDDAISKAIDDMVSMKASLRDKSVFGSTDYIETLA